jgi:hypothetical protein
VSRYKIKQQTKVLNIFDRLISGDKGTKFEGGAPEEEDKSLYGELVESDVTGYESKTIVGGLVSILI